MTWLLCALSLLALGARVRANESAWADAPFTLKADPAAPATAAACAAANELNQWDDETQTCFEFRGGVELTRELGHFDAQNDPNEWEAATNGVVRKRAAADLPRSVHWDAPAAPYGLPARGNYARNQQGCGSCMIYSTLQAIEIWANMLREAAMGRVVRPAAPPAFAPAAGRRYVCATTVSKVRAEPCVRSRELPQRALPGSPLELLPDAAPAGAPGCDDGLRWLHVREAQSGAWEGYVTTKFSERCFDDERKRAVQGSTKDGRVIVDVLNHVHCMQKHQERKNHNVCNGNAPSHVYQYLAVQQERSRFTSQPAAVISVHPDPSEDLNGPGVALPRVCVERNAIDPKIPFLTTAFPKLVEAEGVSDTRQGSQWMHTTVHRSIFSPFRAEISPADHRKKLQAVMRAASYGPATMVLFICGDMRSGFGQASGIISLRNCPSRIKTESRPSVVLHAVALVGYERGATDETSYFIFKNSYSPRWGEYGYGKLSMELASSPFWGGVDMMILRPHDSIVNPFMPQWLDAEHEFGNNRLLQGAGEEPCAQENSPIGCNALDADVFIKPGKYFGTLSELPKNVVFDNFSFKLVIKGDKVGAPDTVHVRTTIKYGDAGADRARTETVSNLRWTTVSIGGDTYQSARVKVGNPATSVRSIEWSRIAFRVEHRSPYVVSMSDVKMTDINDEQSARFRKDAADAVDDSSVVVTDSAARVAGASVASTLLLAAALL